MNACRGKILLFLFFLLTSCIRNEVNPDFGGKHTFIKYYGNGGDGLGAAVFPVTGAGADEEYDIFGTEEANGSQSLVMIRTDNAGNNSQTSLIGEEIQGYRIVDIRKAGDRYVTMGIVGQNKIMMRIIEQDLSISDTSYTFSRSVDGRKLIATGDGGWLLLSTILVSGRPDTRDILLIRTDAAGAEIWRKEIGLDQVEDRGEDVLATADGNFLISGTTELSVENKKRVLRVLKVNGAGQILWDLIFPGKELDGAAIVPYNQDYVIMSNQLGGYKDGIYFTRVSLNGSFITADQVVSLDESFAPGMRVDDIMKTVDSGYVIAGNTTAGSQTDFLILKTDRYLSLDWSRVYGGNGNDRISWITQTGDGGFIATGAFELGSQLIFLLKTDSFGRLSLVK